MTVNYLYDLCCYAKENGVLKALAVDIDTTLKRNPALNRVFEGALIVVAWAALSIDYCINPAPYTRRSVQTAAPVAMQYIPGKPEPTISRPVGYELGTLEGVIDITPKQAISQLEQTFRFDPEADEAKNKIANINPAKSILGGLISRILQHNKCNENQSKTEPERIQAHHGSIEFLAEDYAINRFSRDVLARCKYEVPSGAEFDEKIFRPFYRSKSYTN